MALVGDRDIQVDGLIPVSAVPGTAVVSGFVDYDSSERAIRLGNSSRWDIAMNAIFTEKMQLRITLADDEWAAGSFPNTTNLDTRVVRTYLVWHVRTGHLPDMVSSKSGTFLIWQASEARRQQVMIFCLR